METWLAFYKIVLGLWNQHWEKEKFDLLTEQKIFSLLFLLCWHYEKKKNKSIQAGLPVV